MIKIGFISLGCSKNLVDSENIIAMFPEDTFEISNNPEECEVIFINTCGFILAAKEEAINTILEMAAYKENKLKKLIVSGCLVQRYLRELKEELPEVDAFIRVDDYGAMHQILAECLNYDFKQYDPNERALLTPKHFAYLKIAEGCNHVCAYCAIPLIRGKFKSYPLEDLLKQARELEAKGVKELVLVAQDSAYYGRDIYGRYCLDSLLQELDKLNFKWIRILYLYPDELSTDILTTIKNSKHILPYFDMPIQYGSDRILKLMRRPTSVNFLEKKLDLINEIFAGKAIMRTTFMVGFPTETETDFLESLAFIKKHQFHSLGAFTYSLEEDTAAYDMEQVEEDIKQERYQRLMAVQKEIACKHNESRINESYEVLVESYDSLHHIAYGRAYFSAPEGVDPIIIIRNVKDIKVGEFYKVLIKSYQDYDLIGELDEI